MVLVLVWLFLVCEVSCNSLWFNNGQRLLINNSYIYYTNISDGDNALKCVTINSDCCTDSADGDWRDDRDQMTPLVCMSLEDLERSVSTAIVIAFQTHQDCGDVI